MSGRLIHMAFVVTVATSAIACGMRPVVACGDSSADRRAADVALEALSSDLRGRILHAAVRTSPVVSCRGPGLAIAALEGAGEEGKYWELMDLLLERQTEWGEQREPQTDKMIRYGDELGLDLSSALTDPDLRIAERDLEDAMAVGVRGTPTFFVDGTEVRLDGIRAAIEAALAG